MRAREAFTLIELLVVIATIGVLSAFLLPAIGRAKQNSRKIACVSNLRQVNLAVRLYAEDAGDSLPVLPDPNPYPNGMGAFYKELVKGYLGLSGPAAPTERVFVCPSDQAIFTTRIHAFTSYTFNGYETGPGSLRRVTGQNFSALANPVRAVIVGEWPAFFGGSWHPFVKGLYRNAPNTLGFADGHVASTKIFWNGQTGAEPRDYEPPANFGYSWSGE
jgi:prepilin-type N-terminal cleavage/methylation domain-containing protein